MTDSIAIHCEPRIDWQARRAPQLKAGLDKLGIPSFITPRRDRMTYKAILLGTSCWRGIEKTGDFLLVDRASYGDPEFVSLVWNGHGRRGSHRVPKELPHSRWKKHKKQLQIFDWDGWGDRVVLCGQTDTWTSEWTTLESWYAAVMDEVKVTHFRRHPAGHNPTKLPETSDWTNAGLVITLNSSIAVESVMDGIPTVVMDFGGMAWDVASHNPSEKPVTPDRENWLEWLAWTQFEWSEIEQGEPIKHLFKDFR